MSAKNLDAEKLEQEFAEFESEYWKKVEKTLVRRFKVAKATAERLVAAYKQEIENQGIGAIVYHQDVAEAAAGAKALDERNHPNAISAPGVQCPPAIPKRRKLA